MATTETKGRGLTAGTGSSEDSILELFQVAALILGNKEEAVTTVEKTFAGVQVDPCVEPERAFRESRDLVVHIALERAVALDPGAFKPDTIAPGSELCVDTEDLASTGVTTEQLTQLASGSGRTRLREWLEHLGPESRAVFVLRAMMGRDSKAIAEDLRLANGGSGWTSEQVGRVFRGALCSLANSLVHAPLVS